MTAHRVENLADGVTLYCADARLVLSELQDCTFDSCVTDPPYALVSIVKRFGSPNAAPAKGNDAYMRASAGFMGKTWDTGEVAFDHAFWAEVLRVLKPGAHLVAFGASRGYHRMACAIEDAGFEVRDSLMWVYGTGFPKSHNMGGEWEGWGTALKPAFEPIVLARKTLSEKTVAANVLRWGTGAINVGATRIGTEGGTKRGSQTAYPKNADGTEDRSQHWARTGHEIAQLDAGRWPANVVHDGSDEVVGAFPGARSAGSAASAGSKGTGNGITYMPVKPQGVIYDDSGSAARFFFNTAESDLEWLVRNLPSALANDAVRCSSLDENQAVSVLSNAVALSTPLLALKSTGSPEHFTGVTPNELRRISEVVTETILSIGEKCSSALLPEKHTRSDSLASVAVVREQTGIITITISRLKSNGSAAPATFSGTLANSAHGVKDCAKRFHYSAKASKADRAGSKHPTVKPISLMQWLARLITPPGGTVLDPFAGSGTTGAACLREGFQCVLIERDEEYAADIRNRFAAPIVARDIPSKPQLQSVDLPLFGWAS